MLEQHVVVTSEFAQKPVVGFVLSGEELLKNSARSSDCRFGYRRILNMLREQFPGVNHKRIYRLYRQANLTAKKLRKVKCSAQ